MALLPSLGMLMSLSRFMPWKIQPQSELGVGRKGEGGGVLDLWCV